MTSSATSTIYNSANAESDPSGYTNYVNVHLSFDKLTDSNYAKWSSSIRLWSS